MRLIEGKLERETRIRQQHTEYEGTGVCKGVVEQATDDVRVVLACIPGCVVIYAYEVVGAPQLRRLLH